MTEQEPSPVREEPSRDCLWSSAARYSPLFRASRPAVLARPAREPWCSAGRGRRVGGASGPSGPP